MLRKNFLFLTSFLASIYTFSPNPSFAMDLPGEGVEISLDDSEHSSSPSLKRANGDVREPDQKKEPTTKYFSSVEDNVDEILITVLQPDSPNDLRDNGDNRAYPAELSSRQKLTDISSIIPDPTHSVREAFNKFFKKNDIYSAGNIEPDETGVVVYFKNKNPHSKDWFDPYEFFTALDEEFFLQSVSIKTRILQFLGAIIGGSVSWGLGPATLSLTQDIFNGKIPIGGNIAYAIVFTGIGCTMPPFIYFMSKIGGKIGNFLFDHNGFTPSEEGSKVPHINKNEYPIISQVFSSFSAVVRALPIPTLFLKAEISVDPDYGYGLIGSLGLALFARTYDDGMNFWWRFGNNQINKRSMMLELKKRILIDSLLKTKKHINSRDEFANLFYEQLTKKIASLKQEKLKKTKFNEALIQAYDDIRSDYYGYEYLLPAEKDKTFQTIKNRISRSLLELVYQFLCAEFVSERIDFDQSTIRGQIKEKIESCVKTYVKKTKPFTIENKEEIINNLNNLVHQELRDKKLEFYIKRKINLMSDLQTLLKKFFYIENQMLMQNNQSISEFLHSFSSKYVKKENVTSAYNQDMSTRLGKKICSLFANILKDGIVAFHTTTIFPTKAKKISQALLDKIVEIFEVNAGSCAPRKGQELWTEFLNEINHHLPASHCNAQEIVIAAIEKLSNSEENWPIIDTLCQWIQKIHGTVTFGNDIEVSESDTSFCLFTLFLMRDKDPAVNEIRDVKEEFQEAIQKVEKTFSRASYASSTELPQIKKRQKATQLQSPADNPDFKKMEEAGQKLAGLKVEEFSALITMIDRIVPQSLSKKFLENLSILFHGAATEGRLLITYWAVNEILTQLFNVNEDVAFYTGIGFGSVDVLGRWFQEWFLQQDTFSSILGIGTRTTDYWPLRWARTVLSSVGTTFTNLSTVGILFNFTNQPLYRKILVTILTCPSECAAFFHFFQENWGGIIRDVAALFKPCILTVEQKKACLNDYIDQAIKFIFESDRLTTEEIVANSQGGL